MTVEKKIVVPEGMLKAAMPEVAEGFPLEPTVKRTVQNVLEAALRWLSENPIAPTMTQLEAMRDKRDKGHPCILDGVWYAEEWQRRMFLAPREPEVPEQIKDLLVPVRNLDEAHAGYGGTVLDHNHDVLEAFRRGQEISLNRPKCGECVASLIAGASFFPCALPRGHYGGHRAEGNCFKHGPYFGKNNAVPECPQWPECAEPPFTAEQILRTNREVLSDDPVL